MKNLLSFLLTLLFSSGASAEWVPYISNSVSGDIWFYDTKKIKKRGDIVYVWTRTKYGERTEFGDGSAEVYYQINCAEYSYTFLRSTYYTDKNWTNQSAQEGEGEKQYIQPNSTYKLLANIVCKE